MGMGVHPVYLCVEDGEGERERDRLTNIVSIELRITWLRCDLNVRKLTRYF